MSAWTPAAAAAPPGPRAPTASLQRRPAARAPAARRGPGDRCPCEQALGHVQDHAGGRRGGAGHHHRSARLKRSPSMRLAWFRVSLRPNRAARRWSARRGCQPVDRTVAGRPNVRTAPPRGPVRGVTRDEPRQRPPEPRRPRGAGPGRVVRAEHGGGWHAAGRVLHVQVSSRRRAPRPRRPQGRLERPEGGAHFEPPASGRWRRACPPSEVGAFAADRGGRSVGRGGGRTVSPWSSRSLKSSSRAVPRVVR